ncbi:MAG: 3D domain-containing protein [Clostridiales bacterium]
MVVKLIDSLRSKAILTNKNVLDLRWFISNKFPDMDPKQAAKIFADSINKIIDKNLPMIKENYRPKIKTLLFEGAVKKPTFEITCADIFKICIKVKIKDDDYIAELAKWTGYMTGKAISKDRLKDIATQAHSLINEYPFKNINEIFDILITNYSNMNPFATGQMNIPSISSFGSDQNPSYQPSKSYTKDEFNSDQQSTFENSQTSGISSENQSFSDSNSSFMNSDNYSADSYNSRNYRGNIDYENRKNSDFTHVSYNEYKPIYSFEKSSLTFLDENDKNVKKKFSTFIKKVTMRKFLTVSFTAATAYMFAKTAMATPGMADGLSEKDPTLDNYQSMKNVNAGTNLIVENMNVAVKTQTTPKFTKVSGTVDKIYMVEEEPKPITINTPNLSESANTTSNVVAPQNIAQTLTMDATAYDLSVASCGKAVTDVGYGITASGTRATARRTVAVDTSVIPLGTKLEITFPAPYAYMNGTYVAEDTGGAIGGNRIDIFMGEDTNGSTAVHDLCMAFGRRQITVKILK